MPPRKSHEHLPPLLNEVADVIGIEAAIKLAGAVGGTRVYVPKFSDDNHWITKLIGREAADKFCELFARENLSIPLGPHATELNIGAQVVALNSLGLSPSKIARILNVSDRTVWRHRARHKKLIERKQTTPLLNKDDLNARE